MCGQIGKIHCPLLSIQYVENNSFTKMVLFYIVTKNYFVYKVALMHNVLLITRLFRYIYGK
ncbi:hypothetical protein Saga11_05450 [Bacillus safensis]|nr:hypothetical protein Saga11_05450 [Bacillus safensis]